MYLLCDQGIEDGVENFRTVYFVCQSGQVLLDIVVFLIMSEHALNDPGQLLGGSSLLFRLLLVFLAPAFALVALLTFIVGSG